MFIRTLIQPPFIQFGNSCLVPKLSSKVSYIQRKYGRESDENPNYSKFQLVKYVRKNGLLEHLFNSPSFNLFVKPCLVPKFEVIIKNIIYSEKTGNMLNYNYVIFSML